MIPRIASFSLFVLAATLAHAQTPAEQLYSEQCAGCHGADRLGGTGPALIPETLRRMRGPAVAKVIINGRPATQMPAFSSVMTGDEIAALEKYVKAPLASVPRWTAADTEQSRSIAADYEPATQRSSRLTHSTFSSLSRPAITMSRSSMGRRSRGWCVSQPHLRYTAAPSFLPTAGLSSSCRATVGYKSTIFGR